MAEHVIALASSTLATGKSSGRQPAARDLATRARAWQNTPSIAPIVLIGPRCRAIVA
jgi:hypothetical protein